MSYAVRSCFCTHADNHSPTRRYNVSAVFKAPICATQFTVSSALLQTHLPGTTHQVQWDVAPNCCYQGFPGSWQFHLEDIRASHRGSKHSLSPTVCLNHIVICKYPINTELYINFSKYVDELLAVKSLTNILKFTYFNIYFP